MWSCSSARGTDRARAACDAAALGEGRVVFVTGEPGIGKTSLVTRFVGDRAGARVLLGTCDDLSIPRPLGPLREALSVDADTHEIHALLIAELERRPHPAVLVLEDVHWADAATLDSITFLARRIGSLPALLVVTYRGGEAPPGHPLHAAVGAARDAVFLELAPLSELAVATLAGEDADGVYAATGGNPFYVTELLAARTADELPPSIANAVLGRASRLDDAARRLVELVSVVPNRVRTSVLDAVMPGWPAAAEEPERRQLLEVDAAHVRFRHELARHAIVARVPVVTRRGLHAEILAALLAQGADPADVVHHAEAAGAVDVVAEYALVAARRAAAVDSTREAFSHYRRAADFADRLPEAEQAAVFEELAQAAYGAGEVGAAFPAIERAIAIYGAIGDTAAVARCTGILSRLHWYAGDGTAARRSAFEAAVILEPLGESAELARAYSVLSQLAMLALDPERSITWGERALELATRLGDERTRAHALVNLGTARMFDNHRNHMALLDAHAVADAVGDRHEAARALGNLAFALMGQVEPEPALQYAEKALVYTREHEVHSVGAYVATLVSWLRLRAGEWDEAEAIVRDEIARAATVSQLLAKTVLAELAVRRGDADAAERLADVAAQADRADELQRIAPVLALAAEWALTSGGRMPAAPFEKLAEKIRPRGGLTGWGAAWVAAWAAVAGIDIPFDRPMPAPHAAMLRGDWRAAADAFGVAGWAYDRALMLSLLDDEAALTEAIAIARDLGAAPLTRRVSRRLRELGMSVPRGRRASRREPTRPASPRASSRSSSWWRPASRTRRSPISWSSRSARSSTTWPQCS